MKLAKKNVTQNCMRFFNYPFNRKVAGDHQTTMMII